MRLSIEKDDLGYNQQLVRLATIRFNGITTPGCVTADEERRFIKMIEIGETVRMGRVVYRYFYGDVRIVLGDRK